jgi:hypothetical protein
VEVEAGALPHTRAQTSGCVLEWFGSSFSFSTQKKEEINFKETRGRPHFLGGCFSK